MKHKGKKVIDDVKGDFIQKWEDKSNEFIRTFLMLFGRDNLSQIWDKSKGRIKDAIHKRSPSNSRNRTPSEDEDSEEAESSKHLDSPPAKRAARVGRLSLMSDDADDDSDEEYLSPTSTFPSMNFTNSI